MKPLNKQYIDDYKKHEQQLKFLQESIVDRMDHVITLIHNFFGVKCEWWCFFLAQAGEVGTPDFYGADGIPISYGRYNDELITKNYDLTQHVPEEFLWMDDNEIRKAIANSL
jgi:hypothetical protein